MGLRIALCLPVELEDELSAQALRHGHEIVARCDVADELAARLERDRPDAILASASHRQLNARLIAESDAMGVRILALAADHLERRNASALGLHECIDASAPWAHIEAAIARDEATAPDTPTSQAAVAAESETERGRSPQREQSGGGEVIAVWGPAGAPGRTTLAISIAAELAAAGRAVTLADVDTHGAAVAPSLGLLDETPGFAAACRLAGAAALNRRELERIGQRYESARGGFWVLTGIGRPSRWPELSAERVAASIRACRAWADYTVLDTGFSLENDEEIASDVLAPKRNAATIAALQEADHVIAVGSADPVGLSRFLRAHVELIETLTTDRVTVVMNKVRSSVVGFGPHAQVTRTLERFGGIVSPVLVPHDAVAADAAILAGRTLADVAPKSQAVAAIAELVEHRVLPAPLPAAGRKARAGKSVRAG